MARLILDTGVLVDAYRGRLPPETVDPTGNVVVPAVVVAEFLQGMLLTASQRVASEQRAFLRQVLELAPMVDYTAAVAEEHAALLAHTRTTGTPRGAHDLIVAATARASERLILTTDRHARFDDLPGVDVRLVERQR